MHHAHKFALLAMLTLAWGVHPASAADYPDHPIKLIVPYVAGGSVDAVARMTAQEMTTRLGQSVIVENRPGAGSNIGSTYVARSVPDGYTLLLASPASAINVTLYKDMPYDVRQDLAPVALMAQAPGILLVKPSFPANSLKEFVDMAKKSPGTLNFGSGGSGSSEHLAGEMFKMLAGIDLVHVPYKGGAAVMTDVLSGQVQAFFTNQANVIGQIKGHAIKVLAVAAKKRSALLPDVPTFGEQGYPGQIVSVWWGIMAPAKTPPAILDKLNQTIVAAGKSPAMRERIDALGAESLSMTRKEMAVFLDEEITRWAKVVQTSHAQVN